MKIRELTVELKLYDENRFTITVLDNETGMVNAFNQDTPDLCEKVGVEVVSWLDMMESEE